MECMNQNKVSSGIKLKLFIFISGIIASIFSIDMTWDSLLRYQFIIPLIYSCLYFIIIPNSIYIGTGMTMINISLYSRYIIYPILSKLSGFYLNRIYKINIDSINNAIILMIIEMITILITCRVYYILKIKKYNKYEIQNSFSKGYLRPFVPCVLLFLCLIIIILYPSFFKSKYTFIFSEAPTYKYIGNIPTIIQLIFGWGKTLIILFMIVLCKIKYDLSKHTRWIIIACIIGSFNMIFYTGTSRISILIPSITIIFLLNNIFPKYRKIINFSLGMIAISGVISISIYKFFGESSFRDILLGNKVREFTHFFNVYFQGIENVALGYESANLFKNFTNLGTIVNDIFSSAMGISGFVNNANTSITYFNSYIYNHTMYADQIVPTIIQGYMYFGWYLCFIPTLIMTVCVLKLDELSIRSKDIEYKYIYGLGAAMIGFMIAGNITHMFTTIFNSLIPYSIILFINKFKISKV